MNAEELNSLYRREGWGQITDKALKIEPINVESQARDVARWAWNEIARLKKKLAQVENELSFERFPDTTGQ